MDLHRVDLYRPRCHLVHRHRFPSSRFQILSPGGEDVHRHHQMTTARLIDDNADTTTTSFSSMNAGLSGWWRYVFELIHYNNDPLPPDDASTTNATTMATTTAAGMHDGQGRVRYVFESIHYNNDPPPDDTNANRHHCHQCDNHDDD